MRRESFSEEDLRVGDIVEEDDGTRFVVEAIEHDEEGRETVEVVKLGPGEEPVNTLGWAAVAMVATTALYLYLTR